MTTPIWKKANWLLKEKKVHFDGTARDTTFYQVNDPEDENNYLLELVTQNGGTQCSCTCVHGSLKWEHLCSHKIAVIQHNLNRLRLKPKKGFLAKQI